MSICEYIYMGLYVNNVLYHLRFLSVSLLKLCVDFVILQNILFCDHFHVLCDVALLKSTFSVHLRGI